ncbi:MAG: sulfatase [Acidobacteriota bacterium]
MARKHRTRKTRSHPPARTATSPPPGTPARLDGPRPRAPRWRRAVLVAAPLALLLSVFIFSGRNRLAPPRFNVVLISVDTLRADHVGAYGYPRPTTPNIDRLARGGVTFSEAICQNTNTNPSHTSMLTGDYPRFHGNWDNFYLLSPDVPLLQEMFARGRARTAAFVSGYTLKNKICGLARGFETYDDDFTGKERRGDLTADRAIRWLTANAGDRFFLFVHLFDPHGPYNPPPDLAARFPPSGPSETVPVQRIPRYQRLPTGAPADEVWTDLRRYKARYDAEIAFADIQVGRLLAALTALGLDDSTVVLLTSDHGEALDERFHLLDHGGGIGDEEIHVPMILRLPGGHHAGETFPGQVESIDIAPTLAAAAGLRYPVPTQGKNLLPLIGVSGPSAHAYALTETRLVPVRWGDRPYDLRPGESLKAVRSPEGKLVVFPGRQHDYREFYDLETDPAERTDVYGQQRARARAFEERLAGFLAMPTRRNTTADPDTDTATRDIFCTLGYVDCAD